MTTEDDLQAALDANPGDALLRLVLADLLDDCGDPRAEGYRAMGTTRDRPEFLGRVGPWCWRLDAYEKGVRPDGYLPEAWFAGLARGSSMCWASRQGRRSPRLSPAYEETISTRLDYATRRAAEDDAAWAFAGLDDAAKAAILRPVLEGQPS
jgi:uncharacterized protein (TIGR02996 family)